MYLIASEVAFKTDINCRQGHWQLDDKVVVRKYVDSRGWLNCQNKVGTSNMDIFEFTIYHRKGDVENKLLWRQKWHLISDVSHTISFLENCPTHFSVLKQVGYGIPASSYLSEYLDVAWQEIILFLLVTLQIRSGREEA